MKQLEVQIMGQSYLLACPEGGDSRLLEAVEQVDTAMCKIREAGKVRARERIAVLAALNFAFDLADKNAIPVQVAAEMSAPAAPVEEAQGRSQAGSDPLLSSLLARLDVALSEDGRLL
jgi:cell division protein ZapA